MTRPRKPFHHIHHSAFIIQHSSFSILTSNLQPPTNVSSGSKIRVLPEDVANKIAAGEVVERPASVVKELLENALDAGATRIDVTVVAGGRRLVSVSDNGSGMGRDDALLAPERQATSKLRPADDTCIVSDAYLKSLEEKPHECELIHTATCREGICEAFLLGWGTLFAPSSDRYATILSSGSGRHSSLKPSATLCLSAMHTL